MKPITTYLPTGLPAQPVHRPPEAATAPPPAAPPIGPNPRLRLDPALGVVVMEFLDAAGKLSRSAPTEAQLRAYRQAQITGG
jgi:hypothetical protein